MSHLQTTLNRFRPGFTLVEVLVAVVIIAIGCMAAVRMQSSAMRGGYQADTLTAATFLAESKLESMRALGFEGLINASGDDDESEGTGLTREGERLRECKWGQGCNFYRRTVVTANVPTTRSHMVTVQMWWRDSTSRGCDPSLGLERCPPRLVLDTAVTNYSF